MLALFRLLLKSAACGPLPADLIVFFGIGTHYLLRTIERLTLVSWWRLHVISSEVGE